jgi:hypothetical protein
MNVYRSDPQRIHFLSILEIDNPGESNFEKLKTWNKQTSHDGVLRYDH